MRYFLSDFLLDNLLDIILLLSNSSPNCILFHIPKLMKYFIYIYNNIKIYKYKKYFKPQIIQVIPSIHDVSI